MFVVGFPRLFQYDFRQRKVFVPERKMARIISEMKELRQGWDRKTHQSVVGRLAATAMALPFSPMLVRALALERDCGLDMKQLALHSDLLDFLLTDIKAFNGRSWDAEIRPALTMIVDTSESATGAHVQGSEWRAYLPLTAAELQRKANNDFSSTEGEVLGILRALQEGIRSGAIPSDGSSAVHVVCDNQGAVSAINSMRGGPAIFPLVARIHRLMCEAGLPLSVSWARRETDEVRLADELSKLKDPSDWRLSRSVVDKQIKARAGELAKAGFYPPHIDAFASRHAHQVESYMALHWDGRCVAQNAMIQSWAKWPVGMQSKGAQEQRQAKQPVFFMFPPLGLLPQTLMKIKADKATVWLVCPRYMRHIDEQYLGTMPVRARMPLACRNVAHVVKPTRVNPAKARAEEWGTPLQILFISWNAATRI